MSRFTHRMIESLPIPEKGQSVLNEPGGLYLKIYPSGSRMFFYVYSLGGRQRWYRLGRFPEISLSEARKMRDELAGKVARDIDVQEEKRKTKEADKKAPTVDELAHEYIERWAKVRKKTWKEDVRALQKDVLPRFGTRKAKDISRRDIRLLIEDIGERAPVMANRTLALLSKMFRFGLEREATPSNPCELIRPLYEEVSRDRFLSSDEIRVFLQVLDETSVMTDRLKDALRLILITGQRSGEIVGMRWGEIDDKHWWNIPSTRTKSARPHRIFLTSLAVKSIGEPNGSEYVFPSPTEGQHLTPRALSRAILRANHFNLPRFSPHDLRRTCATGLGEIGIPTYIIGEILNHSQKTVTKIYDRYEHDKEKKQALSRWSRRLQHIIGGESEKKVFRL